MPRKPKSTPSQAPSPSPSPSPSPASALLFPTPLSFQTWLQTNHATTPQGTWLRISKKSTTVDTSITYDQALDTALCYGWIDGQRKSLPQNGGTHFAQRFTPRRKGSLWSKRNVDKVAVLIADGKMEEAGLREVELAKEDGRWERAYAGAKDSTVPEDFEKAMMERDKTMVKGSKKGKGKGAKEFFDALTNTQRYAFLLRIQTAKTEETRQKRIDQFVDMLANGKTI